MKLTVVVAVWADPVVSLTTLTTFWVGKIFKIERVSDSILILLPIEIFSGILEI